jgi:Fe-Mn family superoxide dismutase
MISPVPIGSHALPPLLYPYSALEPYISRRTLEIHHDKHHVAYVNGLNKAEEALLRERQTGDLALTGYWERELVERFLNSCPFTTAKCPA